MNSSINFTEQQNFYGQKSFNKVLKPMFLTVILTILETSLLKELSH